MITYSVTGIKDLKKIEPMWKMLTRYLEKQSTLHKSDFQNKVFEDRFAPFFEKTKNGKYRIVIASKNGIDVGYCVSSITKDSIGEIDSIYLHNDYRKQGVGEHLMNDALRFFDENNTKKEILSVSEGNEDVIQFYGKFGFQTRYYVLKRKK